MNRLLFILLAGCALNFTVQPSFAALQFTPTTNVMIIGVYDSFDREQAGNGHWCDDEAALQLGYPQVMWRGRTTSQAGQNNWGFVTNNLPAVALPMAGSMHGTNEVWFWLGVSGNGGFASTANAGWYSTNIIHEIAFPTTNWSVHGYFTNEWAWTTNNLHRTVFGDSVYYGDGPSQLAAVFAYDLIASNAASLMGVPYIQSELHTSYVTNLYATNLALCQLQFYLSAVAPPDYSHPSRENFQFIRHLLDYQQMGGKTNIFSWMQDFNSASVDITSTNSIAVTGVSRTAASFSCTVKVDCLGGPIEIGDATHTNNNLKAFAVLPSLTNFFGEWIVFSNAPAGTFVWSLDGTPVMTNASVNGMLSNNFYHTYKGAWFNQKMAVLDGYRKVRDINTTNAATQFNQVYQKNFDSQISSIWPSSTGSANYTASMQTFENTMETVDVATFNAAQQTDHTLNVTLVQPVFAPFHR